jgi:hypothetical protein
MIVWLISWLCQSSRSVLVYTAAYWHILDHAGLQYKTNVNVYVRSFNCFVNVTSYPNTCKLCLFVCICRHIRKIFISTIACYCFERNVTFKKICFFVWIWCHIHTTWVICLNVAYTKSYKQFLMFCHTQTYKHLLEGGFTFNNIWAIFWMWCHIQQTHMQLLVCALNSSHNLHLWELLTRFHWVSGFMALSTASRSVLAYTGAYQLILYYASYAHKQNIIRIWAEIIRNSLDNSHKTMRAQSETISWFHQTTHKI